jgi:nucleotide-binding universal stress UspA family protein
MFDHTLVPLDGSSLAECALPHAVAIARTCGARLTLMRVLEQTHSANQIQPNGLLERHFIKLEIKAYLDQLGNRLREAGLQVDSTLQEGSAAERITQYVYDHDVNLVILSSHGRGGLSGWNMGGLAQKIAMRAYVSVMIVRAYQPVATNVTGLCYRRLLVPLDGSQRTECVLPMATTLAQSCESQLLLAYVVCEPEIPHRVPLAQAETDLVSQLTAHNRLWAAQYLEQLQAHLPSDAQTRLLFSDSAAEKLHELVVQENIDLVLLSAHGHGGTTKWPYGNMALNFITYGTTPLLVVQDLAQDELERTLAEMAASEHRGH